MGQSERESAGEVRRVFRERILWIGSGIESLESARRCVGDIERSGSEVNHYFYIIMIMMYVNHFNKKVTVADNAVGYVNQIKITL